MSNRHLRARTPKKTAGFSWGRVVRDGAVTYRLFRRDMKRVLHAELLPFRRDCPRQLIAETLRVARHRLRNTVDEIDLEIMGVV